MSEGQGVEKGARVRVRVRTILGLGLDRFVSDDLGVRVSVV